MLVSPENMVLPGQLQEKAPSTLTAFEGLEADCHVGIRFEEREQTWSGS